MALICLTRIKPADWSHVGPLSRAIESAFGARTTVETSSIEIAGVYDASLGQHHCSALLREIAQIYAGRPGKILGVTEVDLAVPVFEFVFGEAVLGGKYSVISSFRLKNELYGLPPDPQLTVERLIKEAIHELGHNYGLIHCFNPHCVMNPSTFVEQIDAKSRRFCRSCQKQLDSSENNR